MVDVVLTVDVDTVIKYPDSVKAATEKLYHITRPLEEEKLRKEIMLLRHEFKDLLRKFSDAIA